MSLGDLKEYAKDAEAFGSDNTESWKTPLQDDGWVLSHNSIRGELDELNKALTALGDKSLEPWQIECFRSIWKYHYDHILMHHKAEEEIIFPFMEQRIKLPEVLKGAHAGLEKSIKEIDDLVMDLKEGETIKEVSAAIESYAKPLKQHLLEEEELGIPLLRAYFMESEFKGTGSKMGKAGGHAGSFVYYIGEKKYREEVMPRYKIPFFVWYLAFKGAMQEYELSVIRSSEALVANEPPTSATSGTSTGGPSCVVL